MTTFKKWVLFFLVYLCFTPVLVGQSARKELKIEASEDSFSYLMAYEKPTEEQIDTCLRIALIYIYNNIDTAFLLIEQAVAWSKEYHKGTRVHGKSLLFLGDATRSKGDWERSETLLLEGQAIYASLGNRSRVASAHLKLGDLKTRQGDYEAAIDYNLSAMRIWEAIDDTLNLFRPYLGIAEIFYELGQLDKALFYNHKAKVWAEAREADGILMHALSNTSLIQQDFGDHYRAKADTSTTHQQIYTDSAHYYFTSANSNLERSIPLAKAANSRRAVIFQLLALTKIKNLLGDHIAAIELCQEVEVLARDYGRAIFILGQKALLAKTYRLQGDFERGLNVCHHFSESENISEFPALIKDVNLEYYYNHKGLGNYQRALDYLERYRNGEKRDAAIETTKEVAKVEAKYESAKKEQQIFALNVENAAIQRQNNYLALGSLLLFAFGFLTYQVSKLRRERKLKIAFAEALVTTEENERKRIARDLHDGIGQSLLLLKKQIGQNMSISQGNRDLIATTLEEVRSISHDLHPILLEKFGITATLKDTIQKLQDSYPEIFFTSEIENIDASVSQKTSLQIYRTVQEAFNNMIKHAGATASKLTIKSVEENVVITIRDNGKGFDPNLMNATSKSLGLKTMSERIASVKGDLILKKRDTGGMLVTLRVPKL